MAVFGLAAALATGTIATAPVAGATPADDLTASTVAPTADGTIPPDGGVADDKTVPGDKLGQHDRELLAEAEAAGQSTVTVLLATQPGQAPAVADDVAALGGVVGFRDDDLGYVRAQLPTGAVEKTAVAGNVLGIDLNEQLQLPDPSASAGPAGTRAERPIAAPGPRTPVDNPYMPISEIDATGFLRPNPTWDGRGVTIGILDSGVDLDHPALQTTSTGERKIVDWVTATDPLLDNDGTWRAMLTAVTGPAFTYAGATWTAPAGEYLVNRFSESIAVGELGRDVNRDGDTTDSWGILYRASDNAIWVDVDGDRDFTDEELRRPYKEQQQVGHFGTDNPATLVQESVPFVVEFREDVSLEPAGRDDTADFVNIGISQAAHGSHVAGIAAGNALFGGAVSGAAPGATIVSARACSWGGGCTATALLEGMIDLVANRGVDIVNMSIGGLPALNDGNNARAITYNRLIEQYGVQMFISAGNSGPGLNTVGDPSVATDVVSVGAAVSRETYLANYGASVSAKQAMFTFSSRGPREDGGFKPSITAPGSAVSTVPMWQPGQGPAETGYTLPAGYAMLNGTSMASPMAAGGAALLLSAAKANDLTVTPAQLRKAIYSSARYDRDLASYEQGVGQMQVRDAWSLLRLGDRLQPVEFDVSAPVCTEISDFLTTPGTGVGVFDRCSAADGGIAPGTAKTYDVTVTRTTGPAGDRMHTVRLLGDDRTFRVDRTVRLPLGRPVTLTVRANASAGAHGAVLQLDDPALKGVEGNIPLVVVAAQEAAAPSYSWSTSGTVERARTQSFFITVPQGADALRVDLSGIATGSQTRFIAFGPYGTPVESTSSLDCFTNFSDASVCDPSVRTYANPMPGVWEFEVESRRTSPSLDNSFVLGAQVQGVDIQPDVTELASVRVGETVPLSWTLTNQFAPVTVRGYGGPLGSAVDARPMIADGQTVTSTVEVPAGAERLDVRIGAPSDLGADLDLEVLRNGVLVASDADGDSDESVSIEDPAAGTYTVRVVGYAVPAGTTQYDYLDVYYAGSLGTLTVSDAPVVLGSGTTAQLSGAVTVGGTPGDGRHLFGELALTTADGAAVGTAGVLIREVRP